MGKFPLKRRPGQVVKFKYSFPHGVKTQQTPGALDVFKHFLTEQDFDVVIELGTHKGGLALFLGELLGDKLHTFDIKDMLSKEVKNKLNSFGSSYYFQDVFTSKTVRKLIAHKGRVLLLCDNGNKPKEVATFTPLLKTDDIIMAHDYFYNEEAFYNNSKWKACEIVEKHLDYKELVCYEPYSIDFEKVFWACRRRV